MMIAYARCSTQNQSLDAQLEQLKHCDKVFKEKLSGGKSDRPELQRAIDYLRKGDSLVITKLDRLARSLTDLHKLIEMIECKGATLNVLNQAIDTSTSSGKLMFSMLGAFAEFEKDLINERVQEGLDRAKAKGVKFGKPRRIQDKERKRIVELVDDENSNLTKQEIADMMGCSRNQVYKIYREEKASAKF
ncbi:recombinase family protein [Shewanella sp. SR43-4]|jgi:DNA invertase Pin-like site-specific DNA recombinase|uniref:recombinase family protein n=1 Tax=Shewanella sp. SR43-4 TaxID=2760942 RepID=UPI0015F78A61|nr:recombinase family protein [Shewanella sp. SR43-4]MBB1317814.1 recombinase family protein [Shewanella sp. SR43-4]